MSDDKYRERIRKSQNIYSGENHVEREEDFAPEVRERVSDALKSGIQLPSLMSIEKRKELEKMGINFLEDISEDEFNQGKVLQNVELPDGWRIEETSDPLNSQLVDHLGRKRANIFYRNDGQFQESSIELFDA